MSSELEHLEIDETIEESEVSENPFQWINNLLDQVPVHLLILLVSLVVTLFTSIHYIAVQLSSTSIGFNLDDSWIHLEYARSIYEGRAWEYSPGTPSTGSTSPLWSIILSSIFLFTSDVISIVWGVVIISIIFYTLCTFLIGEFFYSIYPSKLISFSSMAAFVFIPSNTWLMLSGMEYPIFMFLLLQPLWILDRTEYEYDVLLGIVAGLTYLARPEGVLLALIVFPIRLIQHISRRDFSKRRLASIFLMVTSAGIVVLPWVLHCLSVTGLPLPDTFYIKVHSISESDIEAWNIFWTFFLSSMPFLSIGFVIGGLSLAIKRPYAWIMGISLTLLYRFTMPYQSLVNNSRYLTPIFGFMAIAFMMGFFVFLNELIKENPKKNSYLLRSGMTVIIILVIIFPSIPYYGHQANVHALATKNINEMQVDIGYWVKEHTPSDAVLAICDVGAIRFISDREIIDLVGLTTPDIAHGELYGLELVDYLRNRSTDYLIIFGKWTGYFFAYMPGLLYQRYRIELPDNLICGDDVMIVFEIVWQS